jgi:hypothetical protein
MMGSEITKTQNIDENVMNKLLTTGDLTGLTVQQQIQYYYAICARVGLDPVTKPFDLIKLNGKLVLYPNKGCGQQLSQIHHISHNILDKQVVDGLYIVTIRASLPDGRFTDDSGVVVVDGLNPTDKANALMKATTKAKRRSTLALMGLNMIDESEIDTMEDIIVLDEKELEKERIFAEELDKIKMATNMEDMKAAYFSAYTKYHAGEYQDLGKEKLVCDAKDAKKKELETSK